MIKKDYLKRMLKFKKIKNNFVHTTAVINWKMIVIGRW